VISINIPAMQLLDIAAGDRVLIARDDAGDYLIGKATFPDYPDAFLTRDYHTKKYLQFNAKALIEEIIKHKDLALAKDKKKTLRFSISQDHDVHAGIKFFEIKI
jgi:hypothetical protein